MQFTVTLPVTFAMLGLHQPDDVCTTAGRAGGAGAASGMRKIKALSIRSVSRLFRCCLRSRRFARVLVDGDGDVSIHALNVGAAGASAGLRDVIDLWWRRSGRRLLCTG